MCMPDHIAGIKIALQESALTGRVGKISTLRGNRLVVNSSFRHLHAGIRYQSKT